jgi:chaperone modulatory protein CbpM
MADLARYVIDAVVVEEQIDFTLEELCRACGAESVQLLALVHEGVLAPVGDAPEDWRFGGGALPRARTALRLAHEFGIEPGAAAIVMDLLAEIGVLRARLRRAEPAFVRQRTDGR